MGLFGRQKLTKLVVVINVVELSSVQLTYVYVHCCITMHKTRFQNQLYFA